jgi:hypothetical protein
MVVAMLRSQPIIQFVNIIAWIWLFVSLFHGAQHLAARFAQLLNF